MKYGIFPAALGMLLLTGCASGGKVSDRSYLRAAAVDGNKITLSFFSDESEVLTVEAASPEEAKTAAELASGKTIFTGYTELIVLNGDDSADTLEYMLNEWKVSPSCITAAAEDSGGEILHERTAEELEGAVRIAQEQGLAGSCDIITVLTGLLNGGGAVVPELSPEGFIGTVILK